MASLQITVVTPESERDSGMESGNLPPLLGRIWPDETSRLSLLLFHFPAKWTQVVQWCFLFVLP